MLTDDLDLRTHGDAVIVRVRARAGASRNSITGIHDGALKISVKTAPEKGKANRAIVEVLSTALDIRKNRIELIKGATNPVKAFTVGGIPVEEIKSKLQSILSK